MRTRFANRTEAGQILAKNLAAYAGRSGLIVMALPRGGVPVACEVAQKLRAPLEVFVVRKLGVPGQEELAMGAIATGGVRVINHQVVESMGIPDDVMDEVARREQIELERREHLYREGRAAANVRGRTILLVDDGIATGSTMYAAISALRQLGASRIVVAAPTCSSETLRQMRSKADEVITVFSPEEFRSVGEWYEDFRQTTDEEVRACLAKLSGHPGTN
jgi:predicted phosphoribosyltransferase